jgi:NTP pyrophosphatase (non-canonical NTP hydrolase)
MTMIEKIGECAMLEQLAEEAAELAQASLKLARKLRRENPTPLTLEDCKRHLREEYTDVVQCAREINLYEDEDQIRAKRERFNRRWAEME